MGQVASAVYAPLGGTYAGPLDKVSGAVQCLSIRACSAAKANGTSIAMNVQRSSDSQTCDLLLTTSGNIGSTTNCSGAANGTVAATFCSAGSGTCAMVTWYDQSGNGNNVTQATSGNQPQLVFAQFGALLGVQAGFTNYPFMATAAFSSTAAQPFSISSVVYPASDTTTENFIVGFGSGTLYGLGFDATGGNVLLTAGGTNQTFAISLGALHTIQAVFNGGSTSVNIDGSVHALSSPGSSGLNANMAVLALPGLNNPFKGYLEEALVYPSTALTAGAGLQQSLLCTNQGTYFGVSTSGC